MRVKLKVPVRSAGRTVPEGSVVDLDDTDARYMIEQGGAVPYEYEGERDVTDLRT